MMEPRAITVEEARKEFIDQFRIIADYWAKVEGYSDLEKCRGVAFSILSMLDGCSADVPAFDIRLAPHPDDRQYHIDNGENWYEEGMLINDCHLHEMFYK